MGDLYVAPIPKCPVHGQMSLRLAADIGIKTEDVGFVYVCHGFDGEGCGHLVRVDDQDWQHIGSGEIKFTAPLDSPNVRIALGGDCDDWAARRREQRTPARRAACTGARRLESRHG